MLDRCAGPAHPEIVRPTHAWSRGDWFADDPGGEEATAPLFFARSLIEKIRACPVPQEIGGHSFSHVIYGDPGCSRAAAESDLDALVAAASGNRPLAAELLLPAQPRRPPGRAGARAASRSSARRSPAGTSRRARRSCGASAIWRTSCSRAVRPRCSRGARRTASSSVPGSMIYFPMHGLRRFLPVAVRVRRARKGLAEAVRERGVFHLWTHPTNLADETEAMFGGLRAILQEVARPVPRRTARGADARQPASARRRRRMSFAPGALAPRVLAGPRPAHVPGGAAAPLRERAALRARPGRPTTSSRPGSRATGRARRSSTRRSC